MVDFDVGAPNDQRDALRVEGFNHFEIRIGSCCSAAIAAEVVSLRAVRMAIAPCMPYSVVGARIPASTRVVMTNVEKSCLFATEGKTWRLHQASPHLGLLAIAVVDPLSLLHLQHSCCFGSFQCVASTG